jgi:hypothetical protein
MRDILKSILNKKPVIFFKKKQRWKQEVYTRPPKSNDHPSGHRRCLPRFDKNFAEGEFFLNFSILTVPFWAIFGSVEPHFETLGKPQK